MISFNAFFRDCYLTVNLFPSEHWNHNMTFKQTLWSERERERFLLNPMENASFCKGMIPQRRKEASDTLQSPHIGFSPIHISTTVASLKAARACVCPEEWKGAIRQSWVTCCLYQNGHVGFDSHYDSYFEKKKNCIKFTSK